jgi:sugar phosphate isomerase/epimerase
VHLKDHDAHLASSEGRHYLHPGEGQIDFRRFVLQLRAAGFDGALSLEARAIGHEGQVDITRIQASLQFIRHLATEEEPGSAGSEVYETH